MAPNWISTAKVLPKSSSSKPKKCWTRSRWPVEDTGRNSVRPSTTPRTKALKRSNNMTGSAGKEGVAPRSTGRGRSGRRGFPASLTLEQRGRANIAQVAPGRPYPKGREQPNVTAAGVARARAPRPPQSLRPHADIVPPPVLPALAFRTPGARRIRHRRADGRGARVGAPPGVPHSQSRLHDAGGGGGR